MQLSPCLRNEGDEKTGLTHRIELSVWRQLLCHRDQPVLTPRSSRDSLAEDDTATELRRSLEKLRVFDGDCDLIHDAMIWFNAWCWYILFLKWICMMLHCSQRCLDLVVYLRTVWCCEHCDAVACGLQHMASHMGSNCQTCVWTFTPIPVRSRPNMYDCKAASKTVYRGNIRVRKMGFLNRQSQRKWSQAPKGGGWRNCNLLVDSPGESKVNNFCVEDESTTSPQQLWGRSSLDSLVKSEWNDNPCPDMVLFSTSGPCCGTWRVRRTRILFCRTLCCLDGLDVVVTVRGRCFQLSMANLLEFFF